MKEVGKYPLETIVKPVTHRPKHDWFLEIAFVHDVGMHVCVCPWGHLCEWSLYDQLSKF